MMMMIRLGQLFRTAAVATGVVAAAAIQLEGSTAAAAVAQPAGAEAAGCATDTGYEGRPIRESVSLPNPSPSEERPFAREISEALDHAFDVAVERTGASSIAAAVAGADGASWSAAHGLAPPHRLHFWASAGKTLVAVAILQLAEERRLSLDDPVSTWIEGVPGGDRITVRQLLEHRSGLFSVNEDPVWRTAPSAHDVPQVLEVLRRHGPLFCPGRNWRYSNSNYILLGGVIERIDGRSIAEALTERIIRRADLDDMIVLSPETDISSVAPLAPSNDMRFDMRWPGAAGPVAATPAAMIAFWQALFAGDLVSRSRVEEMFASLYPMFDDGQHYGLGVSVLDVPQPDGTRETWLGHLGGSPGSNAIVAYSIDRRAYVAVALSGDRPAPAVAHLLMRTLRERREGIGDR